TPATAAAILPAVADGRPAWAGWARLPREARDTLFQLAVIAWTILPHAAHLPFWCVGLAAVVLFWRASIALTNGALPGRGALFTVMAIAVALTLWTERTLLGKEAGVSMLVVLLSLKTLEMRGRRDALVVFFLGFFLVLTHCLYSQSLLMAFSMAVSTWGLLTAQVLASMPVGKPPLKRAAGIAARSALLGLPLMAALFLLFPRIGPLWGLPQDAIGRTGLSGTMRMGGVAQVANDDSIAFRVRFANGSPPSSLLYFRGPVLSRFDGVEWTSTPGVLRPGRPFSPELRVFGPGRPYEMIVEPIRLPLLPLLELTPPPAADAPMLPGWTLRLDPELRWQADRLIAERVRLTAQAHTRFEHGPTEVQPWLAALTDLPPDSNPRAAAWARQWRVEQGLTAANPDALATALMRHIRTEKFSYTLAPGEYGRDAVDEFWFDRREGFCEHFAASFVVMMRALSVPARVVTGYQGAEPPDADGWQVVRQSHAHAWAEYWQPGTGWRRADPTAAVAPERVSTGRQLPPARGLMADALQNVNPELAGQIRRAWELVDNRWNQWVMSYSRTRQFDLLESIGFTAPSWQDLLLVMMVLVSVVASTAAVWAWLDRRRVDPWARLHGRLREALRRAGVESQAQDGPRALARRVRERLGPTAEPLAEWLERLDLLRYGPDGRHVPGADWTREFDQRLGAQRRQAAAAGTDAAHGGAR
ncbi:DUF3488 and transglutaminase-like domain-containing protein, partial [Ideonella sp. A 288]|uniref:transglutaminase family protein n=1 Tax=Ideonella sp. A 288 TaxID=1962181 RepID=UPI001F43A11F